MLQASEFPGLVLVGIIGPLHFANRDNFRASLEAASGISPAAIKKEKKAAASEEETNAVPDAILDSVKVAYIAVSVCADESLKTLNVHFFKSYR